MAQPFREALEDEMDRSELVGVGVVLVVFVVIADLRWTTAAGMGGVIVGLVALRGACSSMGYPQSVVGIVVGSVGGLIMGYLTLTDFSWVAAVLTVVALWLCLDSLYDLRHGIERPTNDPDKPEDISMCEGMQLVSETQTIVTTLRESPVALTPTQIADRTHLSLDDVETVLEEVGDGSMFDRVDDRYTINERNMGPTSLLRDGLHRVLRPLTFLTPRR